MVFFPDVKLDRSRSLLFFVPQENANITVKLARLLPNNMSKPARYGLPSKKEPLLQIPKNRRHLMGEGGFVFRIQNNFVQIELRYSMFGTFYWPWFKLVILGNR